MPVDDACEAAGGERRRHVLPTDANLEVPDERLLRLQLATTSHGKSAAAGSAARSAAAGIAARSAAAGSAARSCRNAAEVYVIVKMRRLQLSKYSLKKSCILYEMFTQNR